MNSVEIDAGLLILRVIVGLTMSAHGLNKFFGGGRIPGTARWFDGMGMRPGRVHAVLAAAAETCAGLLLAAGFLTAFAGALFVSLMFVAAYTVHGKDGFFVNGNGWEYNLVLAGVGVVVAITGPGGWSVDGLLGIDDVLDGWVGFAIAVGLGAAGGIGQLILFYRPPQTSRQDEMASD